MVLHRRALSIQWQPQHRKVAGVVLGKTHTDQGLFCDQVMASGLPSPRRSILCKLDVLFHPVRVRTIVSHSPSMPACCQGVGFLGEASHSAIGSQ